MEAVRRTNESVKRSSEASSVGRSNLVVKFPRKRPVVAAFEKGQEVRPSNKIQKPAYKQKSRQEKTTFPILPLFSCGIKKV